MYIIRYVSQTDHEKEGGIRPHPTEVEVEDPVPWLQKIQV